MPDTPLPDRPLQRFVELHDALMAGKRWFDDPTSLRYAASTLVTVPGPAAQVARQLRDAAEALHEQARWYGPLKGAVRFVVAAMLLQSELPVLGFTREVERIEELFKERKLARKNAYSALSALVLMNHARRSGHSVDAPLVARMAALYQHMRSDHAFLTGHDDQPACALLAGLDGDTHELARRCETFYEGLRDLGFKRGNALQAVSHMLVFAPDPDRAVMGRFRRLYSAFDDAGLWMHTGDYDEVAALSFLDLPADRVVRLVLDHRETLAALEPRPGKELSFSLACATGFLALAASDDLAETMRGAQNVTTVQAILQAQQAAMMAACMSATVAATSASS